MTSSKQQERSSNCSHWHAIGRRAKPKQPSQREGAQGGQHFGDGGQGPGVLAHAADDALAHICGVHSRGHCEQCGITAARRAGTRG